MSVTFYDIGNYFIKREKGIRIFFVIFYVVGLLGIAIPLTRNIFMSLTPLALLLSVTAIILFHQGRLQGREIALFLSIYLTGFFIEAIGVKTGTIFGNYSYGAGLGTKLLDTPLLIGINWVLLVYCTSVITENIAVHVILKIISSSLIMILYDVILELIAPKMDMWSFEGNIVPLRNYIVWFVLALLFHSLLKLTGIRIVNKMAFFILFIQAVFFILLIIFFKLAE